MWVKSVQPGIRDPESSACEMRPLPLSYCHIRKIRMYSKGLLVKWNY